MYKVGNLMNEFREVFSGKVVLITGHTGFKGGWLSLWLTHLGAKVVGVSKDVPTTPSNFIASCLTDKIDDRRVDILDLESMKGVMQEMQPDFVFHLAAQALVRPAYSNPLNTITTNSIGTANILESVRMLKKEVTLVMITSDKAYDNVEWVWGYRETDRLGGKDPYSASKGMAELVIRTYVESFFSTENNNVKVGVARAGNVIGGGDWAVDRIVPDCMVAWAKGGTVDIRAPWATRPWQHVLEPLSGYLVLAVNLALHKDKHGESYNFGPSNQQDYSVRELIDEMSSHWSNVRWNDVSTSQKHLHEANLLKLNCDKSLNELGWQSTLQFNETVSMTIQWYKEYYQRQNQTNDFSMYDFSISQINEYCDLAKNRGISWAIKRG